MIDTSEGHSALWRMDCGAKSGGRETGLVLKVGEGDLEEGGDDEVSKK